MNKGYIAAICFVIGVLIAFCLWSGVHIDDHEYIITPTNAPEYTITPQWVIPTEQNTPTPTEQINDPYPHPIRPTRRPWIFWR